MGEGHIPTQGLKELIRITKPGISVFIEFRLRVDPINQELLLINFSTYLCSKCKRQHVICSSHLSVGRWAPCQCQVACLITLSFRWHSDHSDAQRVLDIRYRVPWATWTIHDLTGGAGILGAASAEGSICILVWDQTRPGVCFQDQITWISKLWQCNT